MVRRFAQLQESFVSGIELPFFRQPAGLIKKNLPVLCPLQVFLLHRKQRKQRRDSNKSEIQHGRLLLMLGYTSECSFRSPDGMSCANPGRNGRLGRRVRNNGRK